MRDDIKTRAKGRWPSILMQLGFPQKALSGLHVSCPCCGGSDRFRFTDQDGDGVAYCNGCGGRNGTGGGLVGVNLIMAWKKINFRAACELVEEVVGKASLSKDKSPRVGEEQARAAMKWQWENAKPLNGQDPASLYLIRRGIALTPPFSACRYAESVPDYDRETKKKAYRPAMISRLIGEDRSILHITFLTLDGQKADTKIVKRFFTGARIPAGGSVRLGEASRVMGVSTGLETSLSAMQKLCMPVWAVLTDVGFLKFKPPGVCDELSIFGDADETNYSGYMASYTLAYTLARAMPRLKIRMAFPPGGHKDWNDLLMSEAKELHATPSAGQDLSADRG